MKIHWSFVVVVALVVGGLSYFAGARQVAEVKAAAPVVVGHTGPCVDSWTEVVHRTAANNAEREAAWKAEDERLSGLPDGWESSFILIRGMAELNNVSRHEVHRYCLALSTALRERGICEDEHEAVQSMWRVTKRRAGQPPVDIAECAKLMGALRYGGLSALDAERELRKELKLD